MSAYSKSSAYFATDNSLGYLDVITFRNFTIEDDDILWEVTKNYEHRPDLLAFHLYKDQSLWWVFSMRNSSVIKDPVFDLVAGAKIYLPKLSTLRKDLGI
jgi:hypothetical protein